MMTRWMLATLIIALPAVAAHEVTDPAGDHTPPGVDHVDLKAIRLVGNDTLLVEVEMADDADTAPLDLIVRFHRQDGGSYDITCSLPERGCRVVPRSAGGLEGEEIGVIVTIEGPVVRLDSNFDQWSDAAFQVVQVEATSGLWASADQAAVYAPVDSDELTQSVDWLMVPGNGTQPLGEEQMGGQRSDGAPADGAQPPKRTTPGLSLAWLVLCLLGVRR